VVISSVGGDSPHFLLTESFAWEPGDREKGSQSQSQPGGSFMGKMMLGTKTSQLTVLRTRLKDSGSYSCRAESRAGSVSANFTLIILHNKADALTGALFFNEEGILARIESHSPK
jgi:hypothetical protein